MRCSVRRRRASSSTSRSRKPLEIARALAAKSDILIENYATGVMDRLGLGAEALKAINPDLIYISASGMGRTGPEAKAVAYGTLLQCYAGFAGLNRHPDIAPRVGFAWLDPMCGLMLAFVAAAALWHRQHEGGVARVDFSMIEAMLWTMAEPLHRDPARHAAEADGQCFAASRPARRLALCRRRRLDQHRRPDAMAELAGGLSHGVLDSPALAPIEALTAWAASQSAAAAAEALLKAGIPAAALARTGDLAKSPHLAARDFWERRRCPACPGAPASAARQAPRRHLGADTDQVLADVLGLSRGAYRRAADERRPRVGAFLGARLVHWTAGLQARS